MFLFGAFSNWKFRIRSVRLKDLSKSLSFLIKNSLEFSVVPECLFTFSRFLFVY